MAFTKTDLDALEAAIASGNRDVQLDGKRVVYRNLQEMLQIRDIMRRELAETGGGSVHVTYSGGFGAQRQTR